MKLWEAMKLLEEGKKVKSINWSEDEYFYLKDGILHDDTHKTCSFVLNYWDVGSEWEEYIDSPKLVELPPHPSFGFVRCATHSNCSTCREKYSCIIEMCNWINNLYKDKK